MSLTMIQKIIFKNTILFSAIFCVISISKAQNNLINVDLKNGNTISGKLIYKDENSIKLQTEFGELVIPKENIVSAQDLAGTLRKSNTDLDNIDVQKDANIEVSEEISEELNQEARWRTIYGAMSIGNTIYGGGIPYVLDWNPGDDKTIGFQLIVFGATYYASSAYTENMDITLGRSYMQYAGANLGFFSILPLTSIIGINNWMEIDPDGKLSALYSMFSVPYGVITADRLYRKWNLNNGQSYLVSLGVNLGVLNTIGILQQT